MQTPSEIAPRRVGSRLDFRVAGDFRVGGWLDLDATLAGRDGPFVRDFTTDLVDNNFRAFVVVFVVFIIVTFRD